VPGVDLSVPVGLPLGTDTGSALLVQKTVTPVPGTSFTITVPGGEVWLVQSIFVGISADATAGNRSIICNYNFSPGEAAFQASVGTWPASATVVASFHLGGTQAAVLDSRNDAWFSAGLPWMVLTPGWAIHIEAHLPVGATDFISDAPVYTYLQWDLGSEGTGAEPIGPYLYVPGPDAVAA
jgi:hypothetical protein